LAPRRRRRVAMLDAQQVIAQARARIEAVPEDLRQTEVIRQTIVCLVSDLLIQAGLRPIPLFLPPLSTRERIDLVALDAGGDFAGQVSVDPEVTLEKVKAMDRLDCRPKYFITFSPRKDKVSLSTFFLPAEVTHIDVGG
jgi:hypothetical protein